MKAKSWRIAPVVMALCAASVDSVAQPVPSSSASAGPSGSAKVEIPPWPERVGLPMFDAEPFPEEKTKAPTADEWKAAIQVRLTRMSTSISGCRAWRLREWMKIHCDTKTAGIRLLAGSADGVALFVPDSLVSQEEFDKNPSELAAKHFETMGRLGQVVFPVRRGDRRVFEWLRLDVWDNYEGPPGVGSTSTMILEEQWLEGAKAEIALLAR